MNSESLLRVLSGTGIASRRRLADAIKQGRVSVNGEVITDFRHPVNREEDYIALDGQPVGLEAQEPVYLILNKPKGVLSTVSDERGRSTVIDLLPARYRSLRLYPVGRLDRDSTGLLLLTNDGRLTNRLTHPGFEHEKEYLIHIKGKLTGGELKKLTMGLELEDGKIDRRGNTRKPCLIGVTYTVQDHEYKSFILDISAFGVFRSCASLRGG